MHQSSNKEQPCRLRLQRQWRYWILGRRTQIQRVLQTTRTHHPAMARHSHSNPASQEKNRQQRHSVYQRTSFLPGEVFEENVSIPLHLKLPRVQDIRSPQQRHWKDVYPDAQTNELGNSGKTEGKPGHHWGFVRPHPEEWLRLTLHRVPSLRSQYDLYAESFDQENS